ncbi:dynein axonemal intermediate chain 4 isoform X2 [Callorhinchus milii]|uniref:dynein axonemal intermediate chain 4 isoform X2 n=1 Tax=Callorhinchus milii TaxID=7868 RepID=UPI00045740C0|nr:dynein axonemal intermediate chain 4 isoform X2 [Callorhinchus milii]|eukprot:gi/632982612/ref/XP_007908233.1/ PREDICTED: WD repeat-containing protein 78 isoform X2 [Callorhinchus milii]
MKKVTAVNQPTVKKLVSKTSVGTYSHSKHSFKSNRSIMGLSSRRSMNWATDKISEKGNLTAFKSSVPVQVLDEFGKDVTPHSLFVLEPGIPQSKPSRLFGSQEGSGSEYLPSISVYQTATNVSLAGPFTRSTFGSGSMSKSSRSTIDLLGEGIPDTSMHEITSVLYMQKEEAREQLTKQDLMKTIDVYLTETETFCFLDIPVEMISVDSPEAEDVKKQNEAYVLLCKERAGNDRFVERMVQTFNGAPKSKEVQSEKINIKDAGVTATLWDMHDTFQAMDFEDQIKQEKAQQVTVPESKIATMKSYSQSTSVGSSVEDESHSSCSADSESVIIVQVPVDVDYDTEELMNNEKLHQNLVIMERVIMENIFQTKLAAYRQLPVLTTEEEVVGRSEDMDQASGLIAVVVPSIEHLWSYSCNLTADRNVSSMVWNTQNPDLLAVGYGEFEYTNQKGGLVCCWSLKNPMWPERIYTCENGVTALDFSTVHPNLLAVGMYDGTVALYNLCELSALPALDSSDSLNMHTGPVWQLKWIEQDRLSKGDEKVETLISISADGRITKWHLGKGLEATDLMRIKRLGFQQSNKLMEKEKRIEALISRQAPGMCFDFNPNDTNIYLAGTEEGYIHRCSCSYNEQFLETYGLHKGPVYKVAWSPFSTATFLSCSADWSIHLWIQEVLVPVLHFSSTTTKAVHDIMWSPTCATIFGAVNEDRAEIWDLSISILDPIIVSQSIPGVRLTTLLFAKNTNCILIGDSKGKVNIYQFHNLPEHENSIVLLNNIITSTLDTRMNQVSKEEEQTIQSCDIRD